MLYLLARLSLSPLYYAAIAYCSERMASLIERENRITFRIENMNAPHTLYHYTSAKGLIGILETGKLWATHISYMNDPGEFRLGIELAAVVFRQVGEGLGRPFSELDACDFRLRNFRASRLFVVSFTAARDSLNMFDRYADKHSGYCVGFNRETLAKFVANHPALSAYGSAPTLAECIYDDKVKRSSLEVQARWFWDRAPKGIDKSVDFIHTVFDPLYWVLCRELVLFKASGYADELEWRLFFVEGTEIESSMRFRDGICGITPYIEIELTKLHRPGVERIVTEAIIGPRCETQLSVMALHFLRQKSPLLEFEIVKSGLEVR